MPEPIVPPASRAATSSASVVPSGAPSNPAARLLNLVIALVNTNASMTKQQIRTSVAGYGDAPSPDAFERMFERDKDTLRDLGIPIVTVDAGGHADEVGYRIDQDAYALPAVDLTPAEPGGPGAGGAVLAGQVVADGHLARADEAAGGRCGGDGDGRGRGPRAARAGGGRRVHDAAGRDLAAPGGVVHVPGGEHGRGAAAPGAAVADRGAARRLVRRRVRRRPGRAAVVPVEPGGGSGAGDGPARRVRRARAGRRGRVPVGGAGAGGVAHLAVVPERAAARARAARSSGRCPAPAGRDRAATSWRCRSTCARRWRTRSSGTATRSWSSTRPSLRDVVVRRLREAADLGGSSGGRGGDAGEGNRG